MVIVVIIDVVRRSCRPRASANVVFCELRSLCSTFGFNFNKYTYSYMYRYEYRYMYVHVVRSYM